MKRRWWGSRSPEATVIETPRALSERSWRELVDLVEQGEISPSLAQRIRDAMFEETVPGEPPQLRRCHWVRYVQEKSGDFS